MTIRAVAAWLILVGLFAGTATYILVAVPDTDGPRPASAPATLAHSDGLSDRHAGYQLVPVTLPTARADRAPVAFRIVGPDGSPVAGYAVAQAVPLHLYVVREDLSGYQHLHPSRVADTWNATVRVPDGGVYRLYAEFVPAELAGARNPIVLGTRFIITGDTAPTTLPRPAAATRVAGFTVRRLDGTAPLVAGPPVALRFQVLDRRGAPVTTLEPYLGAYAHVSAFDVLTQALTHLHPVIPPAAPPPGDGTLPFHAAFHHRGWHRLFLQFRAGGTVHLAAFTVLVS